MSAVETAKNVQLKALIKSGIPLEEACEVLNLDFDAARLYLSEDIGKTRDIDELIKKYQPDLIEMLYRIAMDDTIENTSARVSAAKVIVDGRGEVPAFSVDKLSEMYKKMRGVVEKAEASLTTTTPSPSTTTVNVNGIEKKEDYASKN